ncbi:MAG: 3'-5' exonuclease [Chloroflexota bacterium]|nr:3'-5' exonuclease [Chloroflexota bacterium]
MNIEFINDQFYTWSDFSLSEMHHQSYLIFDVEGTGIDYTTEHIIQIGAVPVEQRMICNDQVFHSHVRSPKPIPPQITQLTGVRQQDCDAAPPFPDVFQAFSRIAMSRVLVTQCGYEYDFPLLQHACHRYQLPYHWPPMLDTKALFALLHPEIDAIFSTDFLAQYYQIDRSLYQRHDALGDARLIVEIFIHILDEYQQREVHAVDVWTPVRIRRFVLPPLPAG